MRRSSSSISAFSLLELSIYAALLGFLLTGVALLVHNGMRYWRLGQAHQQAQQEALLGLRKVLAELANTSRSAVEKGAAPTSYVLFPSADRRLPGSGPWTYDGGLQLEYRKWVCFFLDGTQLVRCERNPLSGTTFACPPNPGFPAVATDMLPITGADRLVAARSIGAFTVLDGPPQTLLVTVTARIETGTNSTGLKTTEVTLRSQVRMENP